MKEHKKIILFNPLNTVQDRNVGLIMDGLPEFGFRSIYDPRVPWFKDKLANKNEHEIFFNGGALAVIPNCVFKDVAAVVLFNAQPRVQILSLVEKSALLSIPVIAVEEVYQMLMEQGRVDNYFIPVDRFLVASDYEKKAFILSGHREQNIITTGYFINADRPVKTGLYPKGEAKKKIGLDPERPVATLCLSFLSPDGESQVIRRRLIELSAKNLPSRYQFMVKPHPAESARELERIVRETKPEAVIADPKMLIDDILSASDIILNRGNSQVVLDALERGLPVLVIPEGLRTFFDGKLEDFIIRDEQDISRKVEMIEKGAGRLLAGAANEYIGISREEALANVRKIIKKTAENFCNEDLGLRLAEICIFWSFAGFTGRAEYLLGKVNHSMLSENMYDIIYKVISGKALWQDVEALLRIYSNSYMKFVIQSIRIRAMFMRGMKLTREDGAQFRDFPPAMNRLSFLPYAIDLFWVYAYSGMPEDANRLGDYLKSSCGHIKEVKNIPRDISGKSCLFNLAYWRLKAERMARSVYLCANN